MDASSARIANPPARVLVLVAHPDLRSSRVNRRLHDMARRMASLPAGAHIEVRDLYRLYPDYAIDVAAEQAAAARADLIVWQHPIQWYAMPALMKLWLDEVLAHGWAYGRDSQGGGSSQALAGKSLWLVLSTGGREQAYSPTGYNRYFFDAFLPPYEQTAALCGLRFLPPLLLHGAHAVEGAELDAHVNTYAERLAGWPRPEAWPELAQMDNCPTCVVPGLDRPPLASVQGVPTVPVSAAAGLQAA
jgi:glutathione-regulated potassium-efflux system ancillary protein KefF